MRKIIFTTIVSFLTATSALTQDVKPDDILKKLSDVKDQYGNTFSKIELSDEVILIFVEGYTGAFGEIYTKFKDKKLSDNVQVIGGMTGMGGNMKGEGKYSHLASGFIAGLGKEAYSVFFDMEDESFKMLGLERYSIVIISQKKGKMSIENFGQDRAAFIKAIRGYFN
jgi:hypothetical protein